MQQERWSRCKELVSELLDSDRDAWPALLTRRCGDDVDLFLDVASLMAASRELGDFIQRPTWWRIGS